MKYFITTILALITINNSFAKCDTKTIVEVNECLVDDKIIDFVDYETCSWPEDTKTKDMAYANLICDPLVPLSFFETRLQEWKDINIARITEELRLEEVKDRLKAIGIKFNKHKSISGLREFMVKCNYEHANPAIWINEVFKIENITMLECLESKKVEVDADKASDTAKENARDTARQSLKGYDCTTITEPYTKLLCESRN